MIIKNWSLSKIKCKSTLLLCREKFQNYLADLGKHGKQLQEKNDQLLEELQGLSKRQLFSLKKKLAYV